MVFSFVAAFIHSATDSSSRLTEVYMIYLDKVKGITLGSNGYSFLRERLTKFPTELQS